MNRTGNRLGLMKQVSNRSPRTAELIQRKLAQIVQQEIRDPRLGFVTITGVEVSRDMSNAKIYFTILTDNHVQAEKILNNASSYLRAAIGRTLETRIVPQLHFIYDASLENGRRIDQLIKNTPKISDD